MALIHLGHRGSSRERGAFAHGMSPGNGMSPGHGMSRGFSSAPYDHGFDEGGLGFGGSTSFQDPNNNPFGAYQKRGNADIGKKDQVADRARVSMRKCIWVKNTFLFKKSESG